MKATHPHERLTGTSTTSSPCRLLFDLLPDELMIQILSQPAVGFAALKNLRCLSERMDQLCNYVLVHSLLPSTVLSITIEQEGKSRISPQFKFMQICKVTGYALFMSTQALPRRYYTDRGSPVIRSMTIHNTPQHQQSVYPSAPSSKKKGSDQDGSKDSRTISADKQVSCQLKGVNISIVKLPNKSTSNPSRQKENRASPAVSTVEHDCPCHTRTFGNHKLKATQKEGFYTLEVAQEHNATSRNQRPVQKNHCWKLAYQISNSGKPVEFYVRLSSLSIDVEYLMSLEEECLKTEKAAKNNMQLNKHLKKAMHWVQHRLN